MNAMENFCGRLANPACQAYNSGMITYESNAPSLWQSLLPKPDATSHKYSRGYVLIYGGYPTTGAARLAAYAAARAGAGITAIAVPEIALSIYASQLLSIMAKPYSTMAELEILVTDKRVSAFLIGPGAGVKEETCRNTLAMLRTENPVVIDADALTAFAAQADLLKTSIVAPCILTPHDGEFERLFGISPGIQLNERIQQTLLAAKQMGAVVLLKGAQTVIAAPDGRVIVNEHAPATLATAGAGDVLAGIITSLLAQGMPAPEAAAAGCWIHSEAARMFGIGLIAEDIPEYIPAVLEQLMA